MAIGPTGGISNVTALPSDIDFVLDRASDPEAFERWQEAARAAGWCEHPVRLSGMSRSFDPQTGEILSSYSTLDEPDGHLLKACGTRRATVCEPCSAVYRADAWHLIAAGLRGGKGVSAEASTHPILFLTVTAPSFGAVHSGRDGSGSEQWCHPRPSGRCPHGLPTHCLEVHRPGDEALGEPLCGDCFDYLRAVLWNAHVTELWRRTTIAIQRELAKVLGVSSPGLSDRARLSYAKVVEYQDRGLVHLHVVIRLDGPGGPIDPPLAALTLERFETAVITACQRVHFAYPLTADVSGNIRWGEQLDVRQVRLDSISPGAVAAYIAKYATKSTDALGRLDRRLRESDLDRLNVRLHLERMVLTAWHLGGRPELRHLKLRHWAHTLGFRGHWLTKSRQYSTTFGDLRSARATWSATRRDERSDQLPSSTIGEWRYLGRGWDNPGDEWLARTAGAAAAEARQLARQARRIERSAAGLGR